MITKEQIEKYVKDGGQHCPFCWSDNIFDDGFDNCDDFNKTKHWWQCDDCKKKWIEIYIFSHLEEEDD